MRDLALIFAVSASLARLAGFTRDVVLVLLLGAVVTILWSVCDSLLDWWARR